MKPRKWIIAACLLTLVLTSGLYLGKMSLEKNRNIERFLIEYISPVVGGTFDVEKVRIGFFSVYLSRVKILIPLQSFALYVQDIKVGFSFLKLITSHGDFSKSINKIIFINPIVDVSFPTRVSSSNETPYKTGRFSISAFPIKHLLFKNCIVRLIDRKGDKVTIGEQLTGRVWEDGTELNFELRGKLAAKKRNLFLSGVLSEKRERQHVSIRLERADIKKPILWRNVAVVSGKLDGVCELSFSDTTFPYNIDAHGRVTIENGVGKIDGMERNIEDINLILNLSGNKIVIDTLTALWNEVAVYGRGVTGFSTRRESRFFFRFDGIGTHLFAELPELIKNNISGEGWAEIEAIKKENDNKFSAHLSAGGFTIGEYPIKRISGKCSFDKESATVDTVYLEYPGLSIGVKGLINFEKSPFAYSFSVGLTGDVKTFLPALTGTVTMAGNVHGLGSDPRVDLLVMGNEIAYSDIALGNPHLSIIARRQKVVVDSKQKDDDFFSLTGTIDSIHLKKPFINLEARIYNSIVLNLLKALPGDYKKTLGSADLMVNVTGELPNPEIKGRLVCKGKKLSGTAKLHLSRNDSSKPYNWQFCGDKMYLSNMLFPISASGTFVEDTININKFDAFDGVTGTGYIKRDSSIALEILFRKVSLAKLNTWFLKDEKILEKGYLSGKASVFGTVSNPQTRMQLKIRKCSVSGISSLETDAVITSSGNEFTILPFVVRKDKKVILAIDTVLKKEHISFSGSFKSVDIGHLLGSVIPEDYSLSGLVSGEFYTSKSGLPVRVHMYANTIKLNSWKLDSVIAHMSMSKKAITIQEISAAESSRSSLTAGGVIPWSFLSNKEEEKDTLHACIKVKGDLLASFEHNYLSPVGGTGKGEILVDFSVTSEDWHFHRAHASIPKGVLTVTPFVPDDVKDITLEMSMDNSSRLHMSFSGRVNRKPVSIVTSHKIPKGFEPLKLGPINCGVILVKTPKRGIQLFLPGFMERGNRADIEFAPRKPFDAFALSGPVDRLKITGTWIIRSAEFTFPFLEDEPPPIDEDPFPYITWDLDLRVGNRKVIYFYTIGRKRRRLIRFTECYLDPSTSRISIRGRDIDGTFRLLGSLHSYKGYAFYGRNFDRNFKIGLDFAPHKIAGGKGYNNMPIIWGSAEAFSDSSRFDRIKLIIMTRDSITGALSEKGRFHDISFRVSSDFEELPGEAEVEFYREAGLEFITFKRAGKKAGEMVSSFSDQYINRYFLQRIERKLARRLGLDVISFETSIAYNYFNYFYNRENEFGDLAQHWNYLAFANVGVTIGRYVLRDKVFLKWRTELIPNDWLLIPEHNIGFEYQPMEYFWVDFNYGFYKNEDVIEYNPKLLMQLRLPINRFRNFFDF